VEIKCLIIDGDAFARETLRGYIEKFSFLTLKGAFSSPLQAIEMLHRQTIDLIFTDIHMPGIDGTSFLRAVKDLPYVIFVTSHSGYAIEAFEFDVVDYILKPYTFERFLKAINKAKRIIALSNNKINFQKDFMTIKDRHRTLLVKFINIYYIEAMKDYVRIITDEEQIISQCTMKEMENLLPASKFLRLQKSYIVNLDYIKSVDATKATLKTSHVEIPIGLQYRNEVYKKLDIV
jgi:DNA-binding LytR/AlgR family response regulator